MTKTGTSSRKPGDKKMIPTFERELAEADEFGVENIAIPCQDLRNLIAVAKAARECRWSVECDDLMDALDLVFE